MFFFIFFFFFNDTATTEIYTLSLHDALPIYTSSCRRNSGAASPGTSGSTSQTDSPVSTYRSEEHTSELQSRENLVCRLLLEKKKKNKYQILIQKKKKNSTQNRNKRNR